MYALNQSPFYKLKSRRKLASFFKSFTLKELEEFSLRHDNYSVFWITKNGKPRLVEEPKKSLDAIHRKIFIFLSRIVPPEYLQSGVKGRSYVTNARKHVGNHSVIKLDINNFFPSTTFQHVYKFFNKIMDCSSDVSALLARLSTCEGHIPTGSCLSQLLAFYSHFEMFDEIYNTASLAGATVTIYVDDIVVSGDGVSQKMLNKIRQIIIKSGLRSNKKKEKSYSKNNSKIITGVVVRGASIGLPNFRHKKIHDEFLKLNASSGVEKEEVSKKLKGMLSAASQLDEKFKKKIHLSCGS